MFLRVTAVHTGLTSISFLGCHNVSVSYVSFSSFFLKFGGNNKINNYLKIVIIYFIAIECKKYL